MCASGRDDAVSQWGRVPWQRSFAHAGAGVLGMVEQVQHDGWRYLPAATDVSGVMW